MLDRILYEAPRLDAMTLKNSLSFVLICLIIGGALGLAYVQFARFNRVCDDIHAIRTYLVPELPAFHVHAEFREDQQPEMTLL